MYRSFTNRVIGGVCGGLAAALRLNAWIVRGVFVVLTLASLGVGALYYLALWWMLPQESPVQRSSRGGFFAFLVVSLLIWGIWGAALAGILAAGLMIPALLLVMSVLFLTKQVRHA